MLICTKDSAGSAQGKWRILVKMLMDVQGFVQEVEFVESRVKESLLYKEVKQMQVRNI